MRDDLTRGGLVGVSVLRELLGGEERGNEVGRKKLKKNVFNSTSLLFLCEGKGGGKLFSSRALAYTRKGERENTRPYASAARVSSYVVFDSV